MAFVWMILRVFLVFFIALQLVPVLIWLERKVVADFQVRIGPNRIGPFGLLQPLADAVKLMMKEDVTPDGIDKYLYYLAPIMSIVPAILALAVIPAGPTQWSRVTDLNHSLLYSLALSSVSVYAVTFAGWSSNNKYALLGGLRASAQMISYELGMGLSIIALLMLTGTLSLREMVEQQHMYGWNIFRAPTLFIAFLVYITCGIAETNRAPFDMAEAESELVAGFHTEYSSFKFAVFFMAEYVNMVIVSALATTLFFGGWSGPGVSYPFDPNNPGHIVIDQSLGGVPMALLGLVYFLIKIFAFLYLYMWLRATLPRLRYDQLMNFGWKFLVPVSLANIFVMGLYFAIHNGWFS